MTGGGVGGGSGVAGGPCRLVGPGHEARRITHWRSFPASERHEILDLERTGPDRIRLVIGLRLSQEWLPGQRVEGVELEYCHHDVPAVLAVFARRVVDTRIRFHGPGLALEWSGADSVLRRFSLAEPYRYVPCRDATLDPRDPTAILAIPRVPELDQLVRAGLLPTRPVRSAPPTQDELDAAWEEQELEADAEELIDEIEFELEPAFAGGSEDEDLDDDEDEDDGEVRLVGDVVATLRIGPSGWFEGARSELRAVGPGLLGFVLRWDPSEPGEAVTWSVAEDARTVEAVRWAVGELDRVLDGFPAGRHLQRLIADGTVEDRFELRHDGDDGEETFRVRLVVTATAEDVRAAAATLADDGVRRTADGVRADGVWTLIVPGRRLPRRARVVVTLERDDG